MTADAATKADATGAQPSEGDLIARDQAGRDDATESADDPPLADARPERLVEDQKPTVEEPKTGKPGFETDSNRDGIIASFKANRGKTDDELIEGAGEGDNGLGDKPAETTAEKDNGLAPAPKKPVTLADDDIVIVKVNGVDREIPYAEARKQLGMNIAAEEHLANAKRTRDEADRVLADARAATHQNDGTRRDDRTNQTDRTETRQEPGRADPSQAKQLDKARLSDVADRIQAGTREEAADALAELLASAGGQQSDKPIGEMVRDAVRETLDEGDRKQTINRALGTVAKEFPDLANAPKLVVPLYQEFMGDVQASLKAIGVDEAEFGKASSEQIVAGYLTLRRDPQYAGKLKSIEDVARGAAKKLDDEFLAPKRALANGGNTQQRPAAQPGRPVLVADRSERKDGLQPQPRSASMRSDKSQAGMAPRRSDPSAVIGKMAAARGQFAAG